MLCVMLTFVYVCICTPFCGSNFSRHYARISYVFVYVCTYTHLGTQPTYACLHVKSVLNNASTRAHTDSCTYRCIYTVYWNIHKRYVFAQMYANHVHISKVNMHIHTRTTVYIYIYIGFALHDNLAQSAMHKKLN